MHLLSPFFSIHLDHPPKQLYSQTRPTSPSTPRLTTLPTMAGESLHIPPPPRWRSPTLGDCLHPSTGRVGRVQPSTTSIPHPQCIHCVNDTDPSCQDWCVSAQRNGERSLTPALPHPLTHRPSPTTHHPTPSLHNHPADLAPSSPPTSCSTTQLRRLAEAARCRHSECHSRVIVITFLASEVTFLTLPPVPSCHPLHLPSRPHYSASWCA